MTTSTTLNPFHHAFNTVVKKARYCFHPRIKLIIASKNIVDHLEKSCLPLGVILTKYDHDLLTTELKVALNPDFKPSHLSDLVNVWKNSSCRRVQEFAGLCKIDGTADLPLDDQNFGFLKNVGEKSPAELFVHGICLILLGLFVMAKYVAYSCCLIFAAWLFILLAPLAFSLFKDVDSNQMVIALTHSLETSSSKLDFFINHGIISTSFVFGAFVGFMKFAIDLGNGKISFPDFLE